MATMLFKETKWSESCEHVTWSRYNDRFHYILEYPQCILIHVAPIYFVPGLSSRSQQLNVCAHARFSLGFGR